MAVTKILYEQGLGPYRLSFLMVVMVSVCVILVNFLVFLVSPVLEVKIPVQESKGLVVGAGVFDVLCGMVAVVPAGFGAALLLFDTGRSDLEYLGRFLICGGVYIAILLTVIWLVGGTRKES